MDNPLFKPYVPKEFCREFVEVKGSSQQIGMYMALVLGFKPLMDDWIPVERLGEYKTACRKYNIHLREDVIFRTVGKNALPGNIIGRRDITTTSAYAFPSGSDVKGQAHIFLSKDKKMLGKGMWYPVIVKDRVIFQPRADNLMYGYTLGYPHCCISFFRKYNDWRRYSFLYETYKNTQGPPIFYCNPYLKDSCYTYIYHMPCSLNCPATGSLVNALRKAILKKEPAYVKLTDKFLKLPFLVFYEKKLYCFEGTLKGNSLSYKKVYFCSNDNSMDTYGSLLKNADSLNIGDGGVSLYRNKRIIKILDAPVGGYTPEHPFLVRFN